MSNLVIVAIPDENDRVWKISSDKIPHLTVLYLGEGDDVANLEQIIGFVEHAANTSLNRFHLTVDRRDELGADQADVIFFKKDRYDYKAVRDFRVALLQDNNIKTAYDSATQFEGPWKPHLTLGYPAAPAKEDGGDFPLYDVGFNKIAVWIDDFDGPEFLLKDYWDEWEAMESVPMDVAMSDIRHYGVKGMRWGVRKHEVGSGGHIKISEKGTASLSTPNLTALVGTALVLPPLIPALFISKRFRQEFKATQAHNQNFQLSKKWKKDLEKSMDKAVKVHNKAADEADSKLPAFNNDKRWKNADGTDIDLTKNPAKQREYDNAYFNEISNPAYARAMIAVHGSESPGGRYKLEIKDHATATMKVTDNHLRTSEEKKLGISGEDIEHAVAEDDDFDYAFDIEIRRDKTGHIMGLGPDESAEHSILTRGEEFVLEHYGVKGMRWGVRKENVASGTKAVGRGARAVGRGIGKAIDFAGDVQFENMAADGRAREQVIGGARKPYRKQDLPAVKARHGDYAKLRNRAKKPFSKEARAYRKDARETYIQRLETTANSMKNFSGDREYTIRERGFDLPAQGGDLPRTKYFWDVTTRKVQHAVTDPFTRLEVIFDDEGYITDLKQVEIENSMTQTADLGAAFLSHYGVKGMRWGHRKSPQQEGGRREGIQRYLDPQGHELTVDVFKTSLGVLFPIAQPLTWPAQIRLIRGGFRGAQAKVLDSQEKKFAKKAMSPKNFAAIHNGSLEQFNRGIDKINAKYPNPNQSSATRKKYDAEVLKTMQDAYRASANSLTNKARTMHLDVEFQGDGQDFKIHAREGAPTPLPKRVKHAAEDIENEEITVEITGKIKRNPTGHIVGFEFDHLKSESMAQSVFDVGAEFVLEHYGVKGMRWGYRKERPTAVNATARSVVPHGKKRKTKVKTEGGENQPASDDAIKVAEARAKLKRSGTAALSNQELRDVANRLQLENQVAILTSSKGKLFVSREFETASKQLVKKGVKSGAPVAGQKLATSTAAKTVVKKAKKGAATAAVAALL